MKQTSSRAVSVCELTPAGLKGISATTRERPHDEIRPKGVGEIDRTDFRTLLYRLDERSSKFNPSVTDRETAAS